jgi:hypothetical protein
MQEEPSRAPMSVKSVVRVMKRRRENEGFEEAICAVIVGQTPFRLLWQEFVGLVELVEIVTLIWSSI